ncbi:aminotransferase class III-fold pyridoxal phosphate-dependent enzyme [Dichotomicrobium thermohalophilum]|uniref:Beta-alanine--pyruvate transaminase n=1 Tax=Dichotomicrobium thermohalophilum TaxID=933063 RepID=A0A397Q1F2_9HYPH|nr:aminotransferase class III-fold pyridoxal phosphate-dependent enzyme [Dichotomicrobium thermohalophilum]RIA55002.1 beta-alanine--pyruvate transaminase [Dichotomicrobium thermohalophilum]
MEILAASAPERVNSLEEHWMPFTGNRDFKEKPRLVVSAEGVYYIDHRGGRVIDGSSGLFCSPAGHARREIADAVYKQLTTNSYSPSFQVGHPASFELARRVASLLPDPLNHVFFVNSGSEAVDTALKMVMAYHRARGQSQRLRFVSRERAYHGVNMGGVSLSGMVKNRESFPVTMPNVVMLRHTFTGNELFCDGQPQKDGVELANDLQRHCETYGGSTIAAVFVEPVAGSTGTLVPPVGYLERLREICDEHGILLVFDEVITGFGRLGTPFASQRFGVTPDITTMAKALTNGSIPMGAVAVRDEIYETVTEASPDNAIEFFHGYTYSAHPAACAAGLAALDIYQNDGLFDRAAEMAPYFAEAMMSLRDHPLVMDIRTIGMMSGIEVHHDGVPGRRGQAMQKALFWNGCHVKFTGDVGIVAPQFIAERAHIDEVVDKLRRTLDEFA